MSEQEVLAFSVTHASLAGAEYHGFDNIPFGRHLLPNSTPVFQTFGSVTCTVLFLGLHLLSFTHCF